MSTMEDTPLSQQENKMWGLNVKTLGCDACDHTFVVTSEYEGVCPSCAQAKLTPRSVGQRNEQPELIIPYSIDKTKLSQIFHNFTKGQLFPVGSFRPDYLSKQTQRLFLPMWMVDGIVVGNWKSEAGYDYQVKSSQEHYSGNQWQTKELTETRIRWEPRLGEIQRGYNNIIIPALRKMDRITQYIGEFSHKNAKPYSPNFLAETAIQLPDIHPNELTKRAEEAFDSIASKECYQASGAQHTRGFSIQAIYQELNWTYLLMPVYITHYVDDQKKPQLVYINGQTGKIYGPRYASQSEGWKWAGIIGGVGAVLLVIGLLILLTGALFAPLSIVGMAIGIVALFVLAGAIFPAVYPMLHNQGQRPISFQSVKK